MHMRRLAQTQDQSCPSLHQQPEKETLIFQQVYQWLPLTSLSVLKLLYHLHLSFFASHDCQSTKIHVTNYIQVWPFKPYFR